MFEYSKHVTVMTRWGSLLTEVAGIHVLVVVLFSKHTLLLYLTVKV